MKTWKLVSGILSIILFVIVSLQSCAAGIGNALSENGEVSGSAGFIVAVMMLAGGIVSIATRKGSKGGNIAIIVLYGIASLTGFTLAGNYADLNIWAAWCLICTILAIISLVKGKKVE
jgi:FtsH-binding integral membrane protein